MHRHLLPLLSIACLGFLACRRSGPSLCPEGMSLDDKQSKPGQFVWCRSRDGKRAQYIELQPGGKDKRQVCDYRDGRTEGPFAAWFPGGKVWIEGQFAAGRPDGRFVAGAPVASAAVCDKLRLP